MENKKAEQIENIKAEDKKQKKKHIGLIFAGFFGGGLCGFLSANLRDRNITDGIAEILSMVIREGSFYFNVLFAILSVTAVAVLYQKSRRQYVAWDGENEDVIEKIERKLSIALIILGTYSILYMVIMVIGFSEVLRWEKNTFQIGKLVIFGIGIVLSTVVVQIGQQKIINFVKEINPEKKGSVYDPKFQQKWLDSCDEAEKQAVYQSAFTAYKAVNIMCVGLCMFCLLAMFLWNIGIVPVCIVGIIWLTSMLSYSLKAMQLENRK